MFVLIFIFIITLQASTYVGQSPCSTLTIANCGANAHNGEGWCYWDSLLTPPACVTLPCYLIDEVAACRAGGSLITGGAFTECDSLDTISLEYDNVCCDKGLGKLSHGLVRFPMNFDGYVDSTNNDIPTPISVLDITISVKEMFKLYTINPWLAYKELSESQFESKLKAILEKYLEQSTRDVLLTEPKSHPFYIERTVYQCLQLLRDWTVIHKSSDSLRYAILPKIWSLALIALTRMTKFQPNYYQSHHYIINFAIIPYFKNYIKILGQGHTLTIDWSSFFYNSNGFMMVYSYPPEQFGIINTYTDVFCIRPFQGSTVTYIESENNYDSSFSQIKFTYYWLEGTYSSIDETKVKLFQITDDTSTITDTLVVFTCNQSQRICTNTGNFQPAPPLDGKGQNYFLAPDTYNSLSDFKRAQCILAYKTWTTVCT
ncbi:unnamed protein product (macronuclear) [Paramecium tetraurelia]|uniref:P-type domain-containing protein n=1 Tax=Paramecium tetraurelia TaxID=5888 RepID=A0EAK6_PARTE|nr:uncharacterized protein GSPATT00025057001 [Paramecium tetraurelia]CAK92323.1 unnamed protein product [Paramecium tetraurelia]|eukprot:XP_001459720.1 hypothetical protein (macronuclear) [Paramecium tetraurelia strain d4-2]